MFQHVNLYKFVFTQEQECGILLESRKIELPPLLSNPDAKLRRQVCSALSQIAKHTIDLAETVVDGDIFPNVLSCLKDDDPYVRKNAATLICEIAKHTPEV